MKMLKFCVAVLVTGAGFYFWLTFSLELMKDGTHPFAASLLSLLAVMPIIIGGMLLNR